MKSGAPATESKTKYSGWKDSRCPADSEAPWRCCQLLMSADAPLAPHPQNLRGIDFFSITMLLCGAASRFFGRPLVPLHSFYPEGSYVDSSCFRYPVPRCFRCRAHEMSVARCLQLTPVQSHERRRFFFAFLLSVSSTDHKEHYDQSKTYCRAITRVYHSHFGFC